MAKEQEFINLFPQFDQDNDGQINQQQFSQLLTALGIPYIYPGSVNKMIRKMNYTNPDKLTLNLQQAKQYFNSLQAPSKHDIWKTKYKILETVNQFKKITSNSTESAPAAPGAQTHKSVQDNNPVQANISILVGQNKPAYLSEIDIEIQKNTNGQKLKPFIKLSFTSSTIERAKQLETVFKSNFVAFLNLLGQDISDWAQQVKNFHINSMVQGTTTVFFITTVNEQIVSLIQLISEFFELSFSADMSAKVHLKYQFQYNFQDFLSKPNSNFYDIFVREARLTFNFRTLRLIQELRKYLVKVGETFSYDLIQRMIPIGLLHLDEVDAQFQFDGFDYENEYQLQTKEQLNNMFEEIAGFFAKLNKGGITVETLLDLLDGDITIQASVGEWHIKSYFRLLNFTKLFLASYKKVAQEVEQQLNEKSQTSPTTQSAVPQQSNSQEAKSLKKSDSSCSLEETKFKKSIEKVKIESPKISKKQE